MRQRMRWSWMILVVALVLPVWAVAQEAEEEGPTLEDLQQAIQRQKGATEGKQIYVPPAQPEGSPVPQVKIPPTPQKAPKPAATSPTAPPAEAPTVSTPPPAPPAASGQVIPETSTPTGTTPQPSTTPGPGTSTTPGAPPAVTAPPPPTTATPAIEVQSPKPKPPPGLMPPPPPKVPITAGPGPSPPPMPTPNPPPTGPGLHTLPDGTKVQVEAKRRITYYPDGVQVIEYIDGRILGIWPGQNPKDFPPHARFSYTPDKGTTVFYGAAPGASPPQKQPPTLPPIGQKLGLYTLPDGTKVQYEAKRRITYYPDGVQFIEYINGRILAIWPGGRVEDLPPHARACYTPDKGTTIVYGACP